jgi:hypothetical protein
LTAPEKNSYYSLIRKNIAQGVTTKGICLHIILLNAGCVCITTWPNFALVVRRRLFFSQFLGALPEIDPPRKKEAMHQDIAFAIDPFVKNTKTKGEDNQ